MNEHDDLGTGREVLKQTIGALVDGATPSGEPSAPERNLGSLRRRVRTWRIAKAGVVGLSTAAVVGALAFSAAQASTWNRSEPLPGRPTVRATETGPVPSEVPTTRRSPGPTASMSPSPSATPSPSDVPLPTPSGAVAVEPSPAASEEAVATPSDAPWPPFEPFDEGYLPWAVDAAPIGCGMPIADLPREPVRFAIEPDDSPEDLRVDSFTITEVAGERAELSTGVTPEYLLFQQGRLVSSSVGARDAGYWGDAGSSEFTADNNEIAAPGQTWQLDFRADVGVNSLENTEGEASTVAGCGERTEDPDLPVPQFSTPLPAGRYEVVFVAPYELAGTQTFEYAFSDPYPVTLP